MTSSGIDFASADTSSSGAYMVAGIDLVSIDAAASHAGWKVLKIDFKHCADLAAAVERITSFLDTPESWHPGVDGFVLALNDLAWMPAPGYVILIDNADEMSRRSGRDFTRLLDTFEDAACGWAERGVPFWAFVALDDAVFEEHGR